MKIDSRITPASLRPAAENFFDIAGPKIARINRTWDPAKGSPVITVRGKYSTRGWTEWTQGFQYGCQLLQYDATGDETFYAMGRENTVRHMLPHLTHRGVHDHGFNTISTYGNLRRLMREGRTDETDDAGDLFDHAIAVSGAVQAMRWTRTEDGSGFVHSFNGPHSLFSDTIRSCRVMVLADMLGHRLMDEHDAAVSLMGRAMDHMRTTERYNVYYGEGRDSYDVRGRVVHESLFNTADGRYRCPSTQQGYSPFTTWTRGLAWILLGYTEELECLSTLPKKTFESFGGWPALKKIFLEAAKATADFYIETTPRDGVPYWDTGAPGLAKIRDHIKRDAQPDNPHEPVDSSAAAIAAQGLLRLGNLLGKDKAGKRYYQAGLSVARTLLKAPYLSEDPKHQGLLLHSVYHRPNGWDYIPKGKKVPYGESSMWGDYHAMELALTILRAADKAPYYAFYT